MKIAQICPRYFPDIGGVETDVKEISERLVSEGHEVEVITTDPSGKLVKNDTINGVNVTRFRSFAPSDAYYFAPQIYAYLRDHKYDIIHAHSYHALPAFFAVLGGSKTRFIFSPYYHRGGHTPFRNLLHKPYKLLGKMIFSRAYAVVCISEYEKKLVESDFNVAGKVTKIPNGINLFEFEHLKHRKKESKEKMLLYVGRLEEYKGVQYIIKCLPELDGFRLTVVGKGPYEKELHNLANKLGVQDHIEWLKGISKEELLECYSSADVFLMLSKREAYGITVAEALASTVPCIVSQGSALDEFIDENLCMGIKYPIETKELISKITTQCEKNWKFGNIKKKIVSWDYVVKQLLFVYGQ